MTRSLRRLRSNKTTAVAEPRSGGPLPAGQNEAAPVPPIRNRLAYAFYATNDEYAVAALVVITALEELLVRDDIDFVVLHLPISRHILLTMRRKGIVTKQVENLPPAYPHWYKDGLTKLRIFQLVQYERVVFLDADTIPLASLDHLFEINFDQAIAAPHAYWLQPGYAASLLLVLKPSLSLWERLERHFETAWEKRLADMEIINLEFVNDVCYLPDEYGCLNSEWEDRNAPQHFDLPRDSRNGIKLVHYTALGKPWSYRPAKVRQLRPNASPPFYELWERWWMLREQITAAEPLISRLGYSLLKLRCLFKAFIRRRLVR